MLCGPRDARHSESLHTLLSDVVCEKFLSLNHHLYADDTQFFSLSIHLIFS